MKTKRISLFRRRRAETWAAAVESSECHGNAVEERREFGRVVKLDQNKTTTLKTLWTTKIEGVGEYVMCKDGDVRSLPFDDNYFDVEVEWRWRQRELEWWVKWWECWSQVGSELCGTYVFTCRSTCADSKSWKWKTFGSPSGSLLLWSVAISFHFGSPASTSLALARSGSNGIADVALPILHSYIIYIFFW